LAWAGFHDGSKQVVTISTGGTVCFWRVPQPSLESGSEHAPPRPANRLAKQPVFSPDGRWVVVCDDASTVRVRDAATGDARTPPLRHAGDVLWAVFSPDSSRILTASDDRTARVWDAATGDVLAPPLRHSRAIQAVFFPGTSERACVVQEGGVVTTWDLTPEERSIDDIRIPTPDSPNDR
jgi:WD40 repeat protein